MPQALQALSTQPSAVIGTMLLSVLLHVTGPLPPVPGFVPEPPVPTTVPPPVPTEVFPPAGLEVPPPWPVGSVPLPPVPVFCPLPAVPVPPARPDPAGPPPSELEQPTAAAKA